MSFTPSPVELALVAQIFAKADPQKIGILTGDAALKVFGGAKLPPTVLGEIWSIADEDNNGWLPRKGVAIAVRLMGWAQKGEKVTEALVTRLGPLPTIEGIQAPLSQQNSGISLPKSPPPALPLLTPKDKAKYMGIFQSCKPRNGLLTGEQARDVFVKSKLPVEKLGQIWNLADTQNRGALDVTDFAIGMYLIKASMSGQLSFIPTSLPPGLYEQAGGGGIVSHGTGSSGSYNTGSFSPTRMAQQYTGPGAPQAQTTGQKRVPPVLPTRKPSAPIQASHAFSHTAASFSTGQPTWDVTAAEKASADRFFDTLDSQKLGYIEGDVAVPFMLQSNLPEDTLAQVWDLVDINNDGRLTRDSFAVAMHLIQGKLAGKEIPASLPQTLVPPSMRINGATFFSAPSPQEQVNLLWDDTPPPSASPVPTQTQTQKPIFPPPAISPPQPQAAVQDPFASATFTVSSGRNLLEDDEPTSSSSPPLQDQSAEIGNVQNQLNSTNRSLNAAKAEREQVEQTLAAQAAQLSALQTQLSSAKAAYETETKLLSTLRDRMGGQTAEIQKAREELIRAESDLSAVRVEKAEIEGAFLRDKEDVRDLHRKMAETGTEVAGLKLEIEKAKKEAKQQRGLLAIARKQLTTKEAEKSKVQKEFEDAQDEVKEVTTERELVEADLEKEFPLALQNGHDIPHSQSPETDPLTAALTQPLPASLPVSPDPASPSATSLKSNNPFDRFTRSTSSASSPRSQPVPFVDAVSVPTAPSAAPAEVTEDPFDFSQAISEEPATLATEREPESAGTEAAAATPRQGPAALSISSAPAEEQAISPGSEFGSDFYSTPPSTTAGLSQSPPPNRMSEVPSIDSQFPPLDSIPGSFPTSENRHDEAVDLAGPLKELEVEESDSDSDEEPLSDVKQKLQTSVENTSTKTAPLNGISIAATSFDDAFGTFTTGAESTNLDTPKPSSTIPTGSLASSSTPAAPVDAFGAPFINSSNPFPAIGNASSTLPVAGVNAFDEAMGKIPSNVSGESAPSISFDSAFEDNFDFASASTSAPSFPPPPSVTNNNGNTISSPTFKPTGFEGIYGAPANNGAPLLPSVDAPKQLSFEDTFSAEPLAPKSTSPALPVRNASAGPSAAISFDDAFGGVDSSQALKLDSTFGSVSSKASAATSSTRQGQPSSILKPFPAAQSPPLSPQGGPSSPRISSIRTSTPPPRSVSPPARIGSPGPRPSTSSSKDGHEKLKEPPTRHSRLSIRLPFGKKKSKESKESKESPVPPPVPPSHYNQFLSPVEEPAGATTPAVEDDVDSVKQLCGMGFSRTQAVTALEKHGYDMQKALNSLLGTQ